VTRLDDVRARHAARLEPRADDVAWLLAEVERLDELERRDAFRVAFIEGRERIAALEAEVERLTDGPEFSATTRRPHPAVMKLRETRRRRDEALARIDEIEKWATDHFGDSTEFPADLAFAFWGMPSAADLNGAKEYP
jgi:hypothetical protein